MLSGEDYQMMEAVLNNKQFLQPLDADNTKASIYYIRQKFMNVTVRGTLGTSRWATPIRGGHLATFPYIYIAFCTVV